MEKFIIATKSHLIDSSSNKFLATDENGATNLNRYLSQILSAFLDADMAVLAKDSDAYRVYSSLIRKEYIHVPREMYCQKRSEILQSFLEDSNGKVKSIFANDKMRRWFEQKARQNLLEEIAMLKVGVIPNEDQQNVTGGVLGDFKTDEIPPQIPASSTEKNEQQHEAITNGFGVEIEASSTNDDDLVKMDSETPHSMHQDESDDLSGSLLTGIEQNKAVPMPEGWTEILDEVSGRIYFYNQSTQETSWDKPQPEVDAFDVADRTITGRNEEDEMKEEEKTER